MLHPIYPCLRLSRELELSGRLADPLWGEAEVVELTEPVSGRPHPLTARARLAYSDECLYIGFDCDDDYVNARYTDRDSAVWEEGCFEAFLCPSGKMRQYYELNISALNTVFDAFILNGRQPGVDAWALTSFVDFTCPGLRTQVHVAGEMGVIGGAAGWSAEYAIPFTSLLGADNLLPAPGDEWRMNLCHISSPPHGNDHRYYSWSTLDHVDFHRPWWWGTLRFV